MIDRRAVLVMRALFVSLALLGACDAGAKPEPRPARSSCAALMPRIRAAVVAYDSSAAMLADHALPTVLASCIYDRWPADLRECIANATPAALVHEHACDKLVSPELAEKVATRFGVAPGQVQAMLGL